MFAHGIGTAPRRPRRQVPQCLATTFDASVQQDPSPTEPAWRGVKDAHLHSKPHRLKVREIRLAYLYFQYIRK